MIVDEIKVLIVENEPDTRECLERTLRADPRIVVMGTASDGDAAMKLLTRHKPDVITVSINLPRMNAFELTRRIMETKPIPVVIISANGKSDDDVATAFAAMDAGAVAVIGRPKSTGSMQPGTESNELVQTIKAMSEVRLVRRWRRPSAKRVQTGANGYPGSRSTLPSIAVVTIGSSTGGPLALQAILERLPADYPVPILIVQHIAPGFVRGLAEWLSASTNLSVRVAEPGDIAGPGHAYLAPDGHQMGLKDNHRIVLNRGDRGNSLCPSITHLFSSAADAFRANVAGVLLTGMGRDGVDGLKVLKDLGALTIAQDRESCVVYGMPGEAVANDAAGYVLSPDGIAAMLVQAVMQPTR